jgi:hypothetical protein
VSPALVADGNLQPPAQLAEAADPWQFPQTHHLQQQQHQQQKVTSSLDSLNVLSFPNRLTGGRVSLALVADGKLLSPKELRAQIKRLLEIIKAAAQFFAQRLPRWQRRRQEASMPIQQQLQQQSLAQQQQQVVCVSLVSLLLISSIPSQHN